MGSRSGTRGTAFSVPAGKSAYGVGGWLFSNVASGDPPGGRFTMDTPADLTTATLLKVSSEDASAYDVSLALSRLVSGDILSFSNELRPEEAVSYELTANSVPGSPPDHYELSVRYENHSGPNPLIDGEIYTAQIFANPQPVAHRTTHEVGGSDEVRPEKLTAVNFNDEEGMRALLGQWVPTPMYSKPQVDSADAATLASANAYTDAHANRTDNPHQVTAAQVDAYTKAEVDQFFTNMANWVADNFSVAAYAGMVNNQDHIGPDIPALTWVDIDMYDVNDISGRFITMNPFTGNFSFDQPGIFNVNVYLAFEHSESNQGRQIEARILNVTDGTAADGTPLFIARNQPGSVLSASFLTEVPPGDEGDLYRVQIGNGSSISSVVWTNVGIDANMESEWKGDPFDPTQ